MTLSTRKQAISDACGKQWDLLVVGGGISGAAIAREAALRGLKTLLVEQRDFAWGTSSRSGKWVHGGLRYMQQGQALVTYHSTREREGLQREVPGLVKPSSMFMTFFKGQWRAKSMLVLGLVVYDLMRGKLARHRLTPGKIREIAPGIRDEGVTGGLIFQEAQTDDARLVMRVLEQAVKDGASALNYCEVTGLIKEDGEVTGVVVHDTADDSAEPFEIRARQVVNATGAWADKLRQQVNQTRDEKVRPLRGSHLVFSAKRIPISEALVTFHPADKRPGFVTPWEGRVIVGNTDLDHAEDLDREASISPWEVDYLLTQVRHYFPGLDLQKSDIIATFSGIRPVIDSGKVDPSKESRDHMVFSEDGLISVTGGKLTTFRLIADDVVNEAEHRLGSLPKAERKSVFDNAGDPPAGVDGPQAIRLHGRYGADARLLVGQAQPGELETIGDTHTLWAELRWAAANEMVVHLDDLLLRRTRIGLLLEAGGAPYLDKIGTVCRPILGWNDDKWQQETDRYKALWHDYYSVPEADDAA